MLLALTFAFQATGQSKQVTENFIDKKIRTCWDKQHCGTSFTVSRTGLIKYKWKETFTAFNKKHLTELNTYSVYIHDLDATAVKSYVYHSKPTSKAPMAVYAKCKGKRKCVKSKITGGRWSPINHKPQDQLELFIPHDTRLAGKLIKALKHLIKLAPKYGQDNEPF